MRILHLCKETYADGPGIRYSIYVAGCKRHCKGCHNPQSWDFNQGEELTPIMVRSIKEEIKSNPMLDGITISGGDPMDSAIDLVYLLKELSDLKLNIWVYTGLTVEQILQDEDQVKCLRYIDTLVDGPYIEELRDISDFKGSSNQRFIKAKQVYEEWLLRNSIKVG